MLIPEFPTQTHAFFWREIRALSSTGVDVQILSTRRPRESCPHEWAREAERQTVYLYPPRPDAISAAASILPRVPRALAYVSRLSGGPRRKLRGLGLVGSAVDLLSYARRRGLDHIHVHSCADAAHVVALCRLFGGPSYSLHLHGDLPVYGTDHAAKSWDAAFVAAAARPMERQLQEEVRLPPERTCTLWMGVDTDHFRPEERRTADPRGLNLVSIGRLHLCKGHVHAFAGLRRALHQGLRAHYTVGGIGPHEREIRESIARYGLEEHVTLVGSLGEKAVVELLHRADAFVLSSVGIGEASPVAVMEAMACGVPPVCSIIGGTPEMVTDGVEGLLVAQGDEEGLARAFLRLGQRDGERERMGQAARERAVQSFDYRQTSRRLLERIHGKVEASSQAA